MNSLPWLSLIIFTPWIGALVLTLVPRAAACRWIGLLFSLSTLVFAVLVFLAFAGGGR